MLAGHHDVGVRVVNANVLVIIDSEEVWAARYLDGDLATHEGQHVNLTCYWEVVLPHWRRKLHLLKVIEVHAPLIVVGGQLHLVCRSDDR